MQKIKCFDVVKDVIIVFFLSVFIVFSVPNILFHFSVHFLVVFEGYGYMR